RPTGLEENHRLHRRRPITRSAVRARPAAPVRRAATPPRCRRREPEIRGGALVPPAAGSGVTGRRRYHGARLPYVSLITFERGRLIRVRRFACEQGKPCSSQRRCVSPTPPQFELASSAPTCSPPASSATCPTSAAPTSCASSTSRCARWSR